MENDQSIRAYWERLTTKELDTALMQYVKEELSDHNADMIRMILKILREREKPKGSISKQSSENQAMR